MSGKSTLPATAAAVLVVALLSACAASTPAFDARFGDATRIGYARQTADPSAGARNAGKDLAGMDGRAARSALDRYLAGFERPEPQQNVFTIGVSGGSR